MKRTLLFATLSMVFALPQGFAATELESLRSRCNEQERQIRHLEQQVESLAGRPTTSGSATEPATKAPAATPGTHRVRPGESLERIARRSGCSPEKLAKINGLKISSVIHPGQKLKLPDSAVAAAPAASTSRPATVPAVSAVSAKTHKIQKGDTFDSISRKNRISVASLIAANPEVKPTELRPGQVIRLSPGSLVSTPATLPVSSPVKHLKQINSVHTGATPRQSHASASAPSSTPIVASKRPTTAPSAATSPAASAATPVSEDARPADSAATNSPQEQPIAPSNPEKKIHSVTIEGEMTYGDFAATHGTDTSRLNDLNGLDLTNATVLAKGSELYVPAQP